MFKFCANCHTRARRLQRVCRPCGGWAIWRPATPAEISADQERSARLEALLQQLLAEGPQCA